MSEPRLSKQMLLQVGALVRSLTENKLYYKGKKDEPASGETALRLSSNTLTVPHAHSYDEYFVVIEGNPVIDLDGVKYPMASGSICYIHAGVHHTVYLEKGAAPCLVLWMIHGNNKLRMHITAYSKTGRHLIDGLDLEIGDYLLKLIEQEFLHRKESFITHALSYLASFWYAVIRKYDQMMAQPSDRSNWKQQVLLELDEYLFYHMSEKITLKALSEAIKLSPNYLSYLFKEIRGINLFEYIQAKKIEQAKELLATTSLNITEIAALVGFQDPFYFSKTFKKLAGRSPSQFRKL